MKQLIAILLLVLIVSACGQSGALYLPDKPSSTEDAKKHG